MSAAKHTPELWFIDFAMPADLNNHVVISSPEHGAFAQVVWKMEDDERSPKCEARVHLLVAAPQLLAALEASAHGLHAPIDGPCLCSQCEFVKLRDAAIAKATGSAS